jgi:hypothetical protein
MCPSGELSTAGRRRGHNRRPVGPAVDNSRHHVKGRQPTDPESNCVTVDRSGLPRKLEVPQQWRTALPQGVEVGGLVVRGSGLPAPVQDPDPLERQGSDGSLVRTAPRTLLPIVGAGPERPVDRLCRPLHERLAQELRALPAPVHPALLAAALGHRGNAGVLLQFIRPVEAVALLAEGSEQARRQLKADARQALEQGVVR